MTGGLQALAIKVYYVSRNLTDTVLFLHTFKVTGHNCVILSLKIVLAVLCNFILQTTLGPCSEEGQDIDLDIQ